MKKKKSEINKHGNLKKILASIIQFTPTIVTKVVKNRFVISICSLAIGGIISNRSDKLFLQFIKLAFSKREYYNIVIIIFFVVVILLLWIIIAYIRLHDLYYSKNSNSSNYEIMHSSDEFYKALTNLVIKSPYKNDLFISIGEGESLNDWIIRICEEANSNRISKPQIRNIYIYKLSDELCKVLEEKNFVSMDFTKRLNNNIKNFSSNPILKKYDIDVIICDWDCLPPFHGFVYSKYCFINSWEVNENGYLHVRTPLRTFNADEYPDLYNSIIKSFKRKEF